jgi:hypothetical protein
MPLAQSTGKRQQSNFNGGVAAVSGVLPQNPVVGNLVLATINYYEGSSIARIVAVNCGLNIGVLKARQIDTVSVKNIAEIWEIPITVSGSPSFSINTDSGAGQYITYSLSEFSELVSPLVSVVGSKPYTVSLNHTAVASSASNNPQLVVAAFTALGSGWNPAIFRDTVPLHIEYDSVAFEAGLAVYGTQTVSPVFATFDSTTSIETIGVLVSYAINTVPSVNPPFKGFFSRATRSFKNFLNIQDSAKSVVKIHDTALWAKPAVAPRVNKKNPLFFAGRF